MSRHKNTSLVTVRIGISVKTRIDAIAIAQGTTRNKILKDLLHEKFAETV